MIVVEGQDKPVCLLWPDMLSDTAEIGRNKLHLKHAESSKPYYMIGVPGDPTFDPSRSVGLLKVSSVRGDAVGNDGTPLAVEPTQTMCGPAGMSVLPPVMIRAVGT